jgi:hypothetical protein
MMAFYLINKKYNNMIVPSLKAGLHDNYELIRRFAAKEASTNQSPELLKDIMELRVAPGTSLRVNFQIKEASEEYPKDAALEAFDKALEGKEGIWYQQMAKQRSRMEYSLTSTQNDFEQLLDPETSARNKRFTITALRNSNNVSKLDYLFRFMKESDDNELRVLLAHAFGWFTNSWKRDEIVEFCKTMVNTEKNDAVKEELIRTISRLTK